VRVVVVGCGYVGLVSAVGLASVGHEVTGVDTDPARLEQIAGGTAPFHEPGLDARLSESLAHGALTVSESLERALDADVVLLAVQSPPLDSGGVDLGHLVDATRGLAQALGGVQPRQRVVAIRSTVPPGTNENVVAPLLRDVPAVAVASNPEFLREGTAIDDFLHPDRVVVGTGQPWAAEVLRRLYEPLGAPFVATTPATAELAKYASNALLATLVSFSNEIARLCEATPGVDVEDVLGIVHRDRRLSPGGEGNAAAPIVSYLRAGCGYGGSCLPKDLSGLASYADSVGEPFSLLRAVAAVNKAQPVRLVDLAERRLGELDGRRVAVLGAAFKAGTDDLRESPAIPIVAELARRGASVSVFDPLVGPERLHGLFGDAVYALPMTLDEAVRDVDACLVTTEAAEFDTLVELIGRLDGNGPLVVDGRRSLAPDAFAGRYVGIGRGA
jgi:UDPglucose 6-dehydrogenase